MSTPQTAAQITSSINTNLASATDITALTLRGVMDALNVSATAGSVTPLSVKSFGAKGDGVTDDTTTIDNALSALASAGGGTLFFPPGNYLMANDTLIPPSNSIIQGAGIDVTTITNTCTAGGKDCVLTVVMTMTGGSNAGLWPSANTTYAINATTLGANTVTTTTAANAGNFNPGDVIMVSGSLSGGNTSGSPTDFWFPAWATTVVSANAGTGVITLAETLPLGGTNFTLVQKIISLPKNIMVRDMTLKVNSNPGGGSSSGAIMEILGVDTFLIENVKFVNANPTLQGAGIALGAPAKRSGYRNCHAYQGAGPIELFGASASFIEGCTADESALLIDGGCFDCTAINNVIKDPQENAASFYGIHIPSWTSRIRCIGNSITGIPSGWAGINTVDTPDANRYHSVMGNHLTGANTTNTAGVNMSKGACIGNVFINLQNGIQMEGTASGSDPIIEGNYFDTSVTQQISPFSQPTLVRTRQQPVQLQTMPSGTGTPTVQGSSSYTLGQGAAQNVTGFQGGLPGDEIVVIVTDANTTFVNSANLRMKGAVNYNPTANTVMCFVCWATGTPNQYYEKSRSQ